LDIDLPKTKKLRTMVSTTYCHVYFLFLYFLFIMSPYVFVKQPIFKFFVYKLSFYLHFQPFCNLWLCWLLALARREDHQWLLWELLMYNKHWVRVLKVTYWVDVNHMMLKVDLSIYIVNLWICLAYLDELHYKLQLCH